ncbi:DUF4350 domain-containing protein [Halobacillus salinus]|nr:DUF4350 domain-containing protein [Halobacillus salinus]
MKANKKTWLLIALGMFILVVGALLASFNEPKSYSPYLTQSPSPTGSKAFYEFADKEHEVSRWTAPPERLPDTSGAVLFMIEPYYTLSTEEQRLYERWMEQGNTIILMKQNPTGLFDRKTEMLNQVEGQSTATGFGGTYEVNVEQAFRLLKEDNDEVILKDSYGALVVEHSYGSGELLVSMSPQWSQNGRIMESDHAYIMEQLLTRGTEQILFDEYIHGSENVPTAFTIYPKWILVLALQLLVFAVLWLWYKGKRFGPIYTPRKYAVRFGDERLHALSAWYMRGGFYQESVDIQEEYLRRIIERRYGIRQDKSWSEIREALAKYQTTEQQKRWKDYTEGLDGSNSIQKSDYLKWSKKLDDLRKEVEQS